MKISMILSIIVLTIWGLALVYLAFTDEWITFFLIASAFIISLFFIDAVLAFFSWAPGIQDFITVLGFVLGAFIIVRFFTLVNS